MAPLTGQTADSQDHRDPSGEALPDYVFQHHRVYPGRRSDLLDRLPQDLGRVLDVGCGAGDLGAALVAAGKATSVCGIDISPDAIQLASKRLEWACVVDLDRDDVPFLPGSFDTVLYADVLEHLKFPWDIARAQRPLLRAGGRVFCSLPNVGHYQVLLSLLRQRWPYGTEGIFDYTHLRFFTRESLTGMFYSAGYRDIVVSPLYSHGLKARIFNFVTLRRMRDLTVWSWWLAARS